MGSRSHSSARSRSSWDPPRCTSRSSPGGSRLTRQTVGSTVEKLVRADLVDTQHERGLTYVTASPVTREHVDRIRHAVEQLHMAIQQELTPAGCGQLVLLLRRADGSLAAPLTEAWWLDP